MEGDPGQPVTQQAHLVVGVDARVMHERRGDLRERGGESAHAPDGAAFHPRQRQGLVADEHVQAQIQVRRHGLERSVGHLHADDVGCLGPHRSNDVRGYRVAAPSRELVHVERQGVARVRRADQVAGEFLGVEREVRRRDHGDGVGTRPLGVRRQRDRVGRGLGAGVDRHLEAGWPRRDEALGHRPAFGDGQQHALPGGPACEQAVDTPFGQERRERCRSRRCPPPGRRSSTVSPRPRSRRAVGWSRRPPGHTRFRRASRLFSTGFSAILRMNHGYHDGP